MAGKNNFLNEFQKQHRELLKLVNSFRHAVNTSNPKKAKKIISKIEDVIERHFNFEETYLYPRIRRLIREMTGRLQNEQKILRGFVTESKAAFLKDGRLERDKLSGVLSMLPDVSRFVNECSDLTFIARKFDKHDEEDLARRFKESCQTIKGRRG